MTKSIKQTNHTETVIRKIIFYFIKCIEGIYIFLFLFFINIFVVKHQLTHVYWLMRIERSETICFNKYENWEAVLIIAL